MNLAICDDDTLFCERLKKNVSDYFLSNNLKVPNITLFHCGEDLLTSNIEFDMVFLDVEMEGISGIHVGRELKKRNADIIFFIITSYNDYLDEALRFHAFRYLSKPLDTSRLYRNIKDALYLYNTNTKKVVVETKTETFSIPTSSIIMIEATGRKIYVHTTKKDYLTINTMQYWLEKLDFPPFFQSHRSYIVNFKYVSHFDNQLIYLLKENYTAYLTNRKHSAFKNAYLLYLDSTS